MSGPWVLADPDFGDVQERLDQFDRSLVIIVVAYDAESEETEVALHPEFARTGADDICTLDMLFDAIGLLEREYDRRLKIARGEPVGDLDPDFF
ncbi:MAG: hypothetical protein KA788_14075 [Lacunisphaera sp.]|nr:hypothetical protein [Lacunisphaera sp.]